MDEEQKEENLEEREEDSEEEAVETDEGDGARVSLPEGILMVTFVGFMEGMGLLLSLTVVGIIITEILDLFTGAIVEFWLFMKGARGLKQLGTFGIGIVADGLDGGLIPLETITLLVTIYLINHQKSGSVLNKMAKAAK